MFEEEAADWAGAFDRESKVVLQVVGDERLKNAIRERAKVLLHAK